MEPLMGGEDQGQGDVNKSYQFDQVLKAQKQKLQDYNIPNDTKGFNKETENEEATPLNQKEDKDLNGNVPREQLDTKSESQDEVLSSANKTRRMSVAEEIFFTDTRRRSIVERILEPITKRRKSIAQRKTSRLISKDGESCITNHNISEKKHKFLMDIFTTLLDLRWRWTVLVFALAFLLSWLSFALIYFIICLVHEDHLHTDDPDWKPCHCNVYDFTTAFLFSLETQHTIGYGFRGMEANCVPSMITLAAQSCTGVFLQCIVTGLVFAKLSRPKHRSQTIMFSEKAVVCQRDEELNLLFRVGDMRKTHIIATSIRGVFVQNHLTKEGELIPLCQKPLSLHTEASTGGENFLFLMWPVTVSHRITKDSPLWGISKKDLTSQHFEIIVILEGTVASTGMTTQVRTSYLPSEILWGHRLAPLLTYKRECGGYKIDHQEFHETLTLETTAECSAKDLANPRMLKTSRDSSKDNLNDFFTHADALVMPHGGALNRLKMSFRKRRNSEMPILTAAQTKSLDSAQTPVEKVRRSSNPYHTVV